MAIGKYPIPPPSPEEIATIFGPNALDEHMQAAKTGKPLKACPGNDDVITGDGPLPMAIFELLECIVNEPPPTLPSRYFSKEFQEFVNSCLKKNPAERADLATLMKHDFVKKTEQEYEAEINIGEWVTQVMKIECPLPSED
eukprot:GHVU01049007.1.p1 GENE.GHVU01049007.1~~GHVU01049007.1.p1  ORF type:complete len:164 (+),score=29.72 GHVU01049007.1:70-492(+)